MAEITAKDVAALRQRTGAGMMECKRALTETDGDQEKAVELLRVKLGNKVGKLAGRETTEGTVQSYIHAGGKVGVLVEVDCNTDFVARNDDFIAFAREVAMHVAASPTTKYVTEDEVPEDAKKDEIRVYEQQAEAEGKPSRSAEDRPGPPEQVARGGRPPQAGPRQRGQAREQDDRAAPRRPLGQDGRERRDPALHRGSRSASERARRSSGSCSS
jgi:translation elongation factor EF-Ts